MSSRVVKNYSSSLLLA